MKMIPDVDAVNKWVTKKRMEKLVEVAQIVLKLPVKGLTIDSTFQADDAPIIGMMLLAQIKDETKGKVIFTYDTQKTLQEAAEVWFLDYLKREKETL